MCLIAFAWNAHPRWPLVICANRDEFHGRPTAPLDEWQDHPGVYGGRDLLQGGGWLALTRSGRLAAVTNVREPGSPAAPRSRGKLVADFAEGGLCAAGFAELTRADSATYGPFNALLWDGLELIYLSNRPEPYWTAVSRGIHGLSNSALDVEWPKTRRLTGVLQAWLQTAGTEAKPDLKPLFEALADPQPAPDAELPDTGVGTARERLLSPPFILGEQYGTRCSSIILIERDGRARFIERRFAAGGRADGERELELKLG